MAGRRAGIFARMILSFALASVSCVPVPPALAAQDGAAQPPVGDLGGGVFATLADADGDGRGNACDSCPLDPEDDADADALFEPFKANDCQGRADPHAAFPVVDATQPEAVTQVVLDAAFELVGRLFYKGHLLTLSGKVMRLIAGKFDRTSLRRSQQCHDAGRLDQLGG